MDRSTIHGLAQRIALQAEKIMVPGEPLCGFLCTDVDREGHHGPAQIPNWFGKKSWRGRHPIQLSRGSIKNAAAKFPRWKKNGHG